MLLSLTIGKQKDFSQRQIQSSKKHPYFDNEFLPEAVSNARLPSLKAIQKFKKFKKSDLFSYTH